MKCSVGSLTFYGEDISLFINLVKEKLDNYINEINKKMFINMSLIKFSQRTNKFSNLVIIRKV